MFKFNNNPFEYLIAAEAAAAFGHAGRSLQKALEALRKYDAAVAGMPKAADPKVRADLVATAGEAYWGYVVLRETRGLMDPEYIAQEYSVPPEVVRSMGPKRT